MAELGFNDPLTLRSYGDEGIGIKSHPKDRRSGDHTCDYQISRRDSRQENKMTNSFRKMNSKYTFVELCVNGRLEVFYVWTLLLPRKQYVILMTYGHKSSLEVHEPV